MSEPKHAKKTQTKSASAFQLTLNEPQCFDEVRVYLMSLKTFRYGIACREEAPSTGHKHVHIYAQFSRSIRLSLKELCGAHVEKCMGSPQQNIAYIKKDGDIIWETGEVQLKGGKTIEQIKKMSKEERDTLPAIYYNIVQKINTIENNDLNIDEIYKEKLEVIYIYGDSGIGKSKKAIELCKEKGYQKINMVKFINGFWVGIGESEACIYDDFRDSDLKASEFINFIDYNKHQLNTKGGYILNNYKFIIITSVQNPEEIYKNLQGEPRKQWIRRLKIIHLLGEMGSLNKIIYA